MDRDERSFEILDQATRCRSSMRSHFSKSRSTDRRPFDPCRTQTNSGGLPRLQTTIFSCRKADLKPKVVPTELSLGLNLAQLALSVCLNCGRNLRVMHAGHLPP
jgi:hypothetical protein